MGIYERGLTQGLNYADYRYRRGAEADKRRPMVVSRLQLLADLMFLDGPAQR